MPQYRITGKRTSDGKFIDATIDASSEESVRRKAERSGIDMDTFMCKQVGTQSAPAPLKSEQKTIKVKEDRVSEAPSARAVSPMVSKLAWALAIILSMLLCPVSVGLGWLGIPLLLLAACVGVAIAIYPIFKPDDKRWSGVIRRFTPQVVGFSILMLLSVLMILGRPSDEDIAQKNRKQQQELAVYEKNANNVFAKIETAIQQDDYEQALTLLDEVKSDASINSGTKQKYSMLLESVSSNATEHMLSDAENLARENEYPQAIAMLKQATSKRYTAASNQPRAKELLAQYKLTLDKLLQAEVQAKKDAKAQAKKQEKEKRQADDLALQERKVSEQQESEDSNAKKTEGPPGGAMTARERIARHKEIDYGWFGAGPEVKGNTEVRGWIRTIATSPSSVRVKRVELKSARGNTMIYYCEFDADNSFGAAIRTAYYVGVFWKDPVQEAEVLHWKETKRGGNERDYAEIASKIEPFQ